MGGITRRQLTNVLGALGLVATLAGLAIGLPILDSALPADRPVRTDQPYPVGAGVTVVLPRDAVLDVTGTRPGDNQGTALFRIGPVRYAIAVQPFDGTLTAAATRMRQRITGTPGYQVTGGQLAVTTGSGLTGLQGGYTAPGRGGRYTVFLAGDLTIEVTVSGSELDLGRTLPAIEASTRTLRAPGDPVTDVRPAPGGRLALTPSLGIVLALLVVGGVRIGQVGVRFAETYPLATLTAAGLFALFAVPFWIFVSELDFLEREPTALRVLALAWGGLVATAVAIPGSAALDNLIAKIGSTHLAADRGAALAGPTVEEIAKTLGVVAIVLIARAQVNSVLDGVVYGAMVGLGFQTVENIVFAVGAVALAGQGDDVQPVVSTFLLRGFLAGIWSHTMFGALAGAGIGYLVVRHDRPRRVRIGVAALCVTGAWACHMLWNSPLLTDGLGEGAVALLAVLLLKGLSPLIGTLWLVRRAHGREGDYYAGHLATLRDPELITEGELAVLRSSARRSAARWRAGHVAGGRARSAVRRLQRAQARLAVELSRGASISRCCDDVRSQRRTLIGLGHPEALDGGSSWRRLGSSAGPAVLAIAVLWAALTALGGG